MQFHDATHERQSDAQSALRTIEPPLALHEQVECPLTQVAAHADAIVLDAENRAVVLAPQGDADVATVARELGGIVE